MTIRLLPDDVADQIAAGEVVERPASVVKELVENSIDAGATDIVVRIEEGGKKRICVEDNGVGMGKEDLEKSILRHATSKIEVFDDIFQLQSFGFRGEALAAISSIARSTLDSKEKGSDQGYRLLVDSGKKKALEEIGMKQGTIIDIRDLFASVPARKEYLKTEQTEYRLILRQMTHFALAYPNVSFQLFHNDKESFSVYAVQKLKQRVAQVFEHLSGDLFSLEQSVSSMSIRGFCSYPDKAQKSKTHQYLFVNNRAVEDFRIVHAVREAFVQTCGLDKALHPAFILFLDIDPLLVDVNVHPRKTEVKFSDPQDVYRFVKSAVTTGIRGFSGEMSHNKPQSFSPAPPKQQVFEKPSFSFSQMHEQRKPQYFEPQRSVGYSSPTSEAAERELRFVGQVANKYLVAESSDGLYIFDQHALHERIRFEQLVRQAEAKNVEVQPLLMPEVLEISKEEQEILNEHQDELSEIGIKLSFDPEQVSLSAIPALLSEEDRGQLFQDLVQYFQEEQVGEHSYERLLRVVLEYKSCRGSIKFGDRIEAREAQLLLEQYQELEFKLLCPHGRPNHVFWSFDELDGKFYR